MCFPSTLQTRLFSIAVSRRRSPVLKDPSTQLREFFPRSLEELDYVAIGCYAAVATEGFVHPPWSGFETRGICRAYPYRPLP